jgi:uncharacterized protein
MKRHVIITGATGGLGKAFALECASRGWDLYLTDLSNEKLEKLATGLMRYQDVRVSYEAFDMMNSDEMALFWQNISNNGVTCDMLINVAGLDFEGAFLERTKDEINTILRLNIEATVEMTRRMLETRKSRDPLYIINVSSLASFYPMPLKATYAASKRFLLDFSRAMRQELRMEGVRVLALCPAGLATKPETIQSIESQGWMGNLTTMQLGMVAARTIDRVLAGHSVFIPGWINRLMRVISSFVPEDLMAWLIWHRWTKTRQLAAQFGNQM